MNGGEGEGEDPSLPDGEREEEEVSNKAAAARLAARTRTQMGKREVAGRTRKGGGQRQKPIRYEMDVNVRVEGAFRDYRDEPIIILWHPEGLSRGTVIHLLALPLHPAKPTAVGGMASKWVAGGSPSSH